VEIKWSLAVDEGYTDEVNVDTPGLDIAVCEFSSGSKLGFKRCTTSLKPIDVRRYTVHNNITNDLYTSEYIATYTCTGEAGARAVIRTGSASSPIAARFRFPFGAASADDSDLQHGETLLPVLFSVSRVAKSCCAELVFVGDVGIGNNSDAVMGAMAQKLIESRVIWGSAAQVGWLISSLDMTHRSCFN
jgi:hypothetical protein